jgi:hypothetical protein
MITVVPLPFRHYFILFFIFFAEILKKYLNIYVKILIKSKVSLSGLNRRPMRTFAFNLKQSRPVLGGSHFFGENRSIPVLS